ncbi:hypothetical protein AAMO2058_000439200 [Amorphochlora amoebiformis]
MPPSITRQSTRRRLEFLFVGLLVTGVLGYSFVSSHQNKLGFPGLGWLLKSDSNSKRAGGYDPPPWRFSGRAIYQLHPVKVSAVESLIPQDVNIVQCFGYTLGGWYLANYTNSPARGNKAFGELVAVAGLVWNPPTSCAWASEVYVGSKSAKIHGEREVGLPEHYAKFDSSLLQNSKRDLLTVTSEGKEVMSAEVPKERKGWRAGPSISMRLPSFSGYNRFQKGLLNYWLDLGAKVSLVAPACKVRAPVNSPLAPLIAQRPMICLQFENLDMKVDPPSKADPSSTFKNVPFPFLESKSRRQLHLLRTGAHDTNLEELH